MALNHRLLHLACVSRLRYRSINSSPPPVKLSDTTVFCQAGSYSTCPDHSLYSIARYRSDLLVKTPQQRTCSNLIQGKLCRIFIFVEKKLSHTLSLEMCLHIYNNSAIVWTDAVMSIFYNSSFACFFLTRCHHRTSPLYDSFTCINALCLLPPNFDPLAR